MGETIEKSVPTTLPDEIDSRAWVVAASAILILALTG
jgi:hypothetical protein